MRASVCAEIKIYKLFENWISSVAGLQGNQLSDNNERVAY